MKVPRDAMLPPQDAFLGNGRKGRPLFAWEFSLRRAASCLLMIARMISCFRRGLLLSCAALMLAACSTRETKQALQKAADLESQQHYEDANDVLVDALRARETKIRAGVEAPADQASIDALTKKVQADSEILKMERAQIPLYLHLDRADLASAVYSDIMAGNSGDKVLYDLLKNKDAAIRTGAVRTLGLSGNADAIDALAQAAKDTDEDVRRAAVAALGTIKDPQAVTKAVPVLIGALNDSYWFVRSDAADALGREKDTRAIQPLLDTVSDPDSNVESAAENALIALCSTPGLSVNEFASHLNDANPKIVMISAVCLAVLKDPRAVPVLVKLASSPDVSTRLHAVKGLGETGDPSVIPTLRQTLQDPEVNVRGWSIIGLDKLKDQGSVPQLRALANDPSQTPHIREFAQAAVNHLTGQTATLAPVSK
jgi:HEAT repeat protein